MQTPKALRALLADAVDYAGMYPPAELDLQTAFANYMGYRAGEHAWMLARFVAPVGKLDELATAICTRGETAECGFTRVYSELGEAQNPDAVKEPPIRVSVVARSASNPEEFVASFAEDLKSVRQFLQDVRDRAVVDAIEVKPPAEFSALELEAWASALAPHASWLSASLFVELGYADWERRLSRWRHALQEAFDRRVGFKWRCGGASAAAIPAVETLAQIVYECRHAGVDWKATAGLHHPLPHHDAALGARMHGFVNLLGSAALAFAAKPDEAALADMFACADPTEWRFDDAELRWRDFRASAANVAIARRHFGVSFGSCSFDEPVADLRALGWL